MELQGQGSLGLGSSDKVAKGCGLGLGAWFLWAEEGAEHLPGPELAQKVRFLMGGEGGTQDSHREEGERGKGWRDFSMCVSDPVGRSSRWALAGMLTTKPSAPWSCQMPGKCMPNILCIFSQSLASVAMASGCPLCVP